MNILEKIKVFGDEFEVFDALHPIGSTYTQYPGQKGPNELWEDTSWEIVKYNGLSFRAAGGLADNFERVLTISSRSGTSITFTSTHNLIKGSVLYDFVNNESRMVSSVTNNNTVVINRVFTYSTATQLFASQKDTLKLHNHSFTHGHTASSSTSASPSISVCIERGYINCCCANYSIYDAAGANHCPSTGTTSDYFDINYDCWANTSTTISCYKGNTCNAGGTDTHPRRFSAVVWRRIS